MRKASDSGRKYGFDENEYFAALQKTPRLAREFVNESMAFLAKLAQVLSHTGHSTVELARSLEELRRVNSELADSIHELEAFTYSVSHDLRAPLRHISRLSRILTEEFGASLPPDAQHHLQRIAEGTIRMGTLVDDLLNLARVGRRDLSLQVAGLQSVVDEVISGLKADLDGRQVEWKISSLPYVECDPGLVKQVFQNLLSNAVKFTRPRAPAVIEVGQEEQDGQTVIYIRVEVFGLADRRKAMSTDLSGGQAKRLLIARALVHRPDVLFLDEPTAGLDPQTRVNLWDILRVLHAEGQTILLTTHYMEEAEALCEQVAVIDHGEVLASGTVNELKEGAGAETVITVRYEDPVPVT